MKLLPSIALVLSTAVLSCTAAAITRQEVEQNSAAGLHLIDLAPGVEPVWKTEEEVEALIAQDIRFFDVTDVYDPGAAGTAAIAESSLLATYTAPSRQAQVQPILANVSLSMMEDYLTTLTDFNNRYYTSTTGLEASLWIRDTIATIISENLGSGATVELFNHTWLQPSIVAKIPGTASQSPVTIIGGHMDSINSRSPSTGRAPGADDNGSGSANILEAFRVLVAAGFRPSTPVEFHWYAAEEVGLRGSQAIASSYKNVGVEVKAMLQLDMTAYVRPGTGPVVALVPDFTDSGLTTFVGQIVDEYTSLSWVINDPCGYACSDHASWNSQGYPAAFPFEGLFSNGNPNTHTDSDTASVAGFSLTHSLEYAKLATAYAYELSA
ncbi:hypothetical protein NLJ89_g8120 [Agrocybe chaxingu]|uniref:Peptide hydrolase n=1 Tax=Agrocybe chaxingu TaxID=84603 RepID=A0A9W8MUT2_9AGAR|nr:hypothetical protein NLJ89_g8120 [Agrocybe chaxingu]